MGKHFQHKIGYSQCMMIKMAFYHNSLGFKERRLTEVQKNNEKKLRQNEATKMVPFKNCWYFVSSASDDLGWPWMYKVGLDGF